MHPTHDELIGALAQVADPELGIGIVPLGLLYAIDADAQSIRATLTLTAATCPLGDVLLADVETALATHFPDHRIELRLSFDPPWTP